ncbi:hypothetical protein EVG20_g5940 [Dentipellis fragilis]|uniref:Uncharacterized protein n=1 Tax=Dentipellis fragilis TaxID=205917 RepID=A0A4Y9YSE9_9AGAM|nr:hypothetical protein EVG20_g5940 [Dentipellis fragilis]
MGNEHAVWKQFKRSDKHYLSDRSHKEAWCNWCIAAQVASIRANEAEAARAPGGVKVPRDEEAIKESLYTDSTALCGKVHILLTHLVKNCSHVPPDVKDWAQNQYRARERKRTQDAMQAYANDYDSRSPSLSGIDAASSSLPRQIRRIGSDFTMADEDVQMDNINSGLQGIPPPAAGQPWSQSVQANFASDLCRLFLVSDMDLRAANKPFVRHFFATYIGQADFPGWEELSGRILDEEVKKVTDKMKQEVRGRYATGQCEEWRNSGNGLVLAAMLNAEYSSYLVNSFYIAEEHKTPENLAAIACVQIKLYKEVLGVGVVAWCTRGDRDAVNMRQLLVQRMPSLVVVDCWAHQMNLVTGDMLKQTPVNFGTVLDDALEIVIWLNRHPRSCEILEAAMAQLSCGSARLILPVIPRWTSHYLALCRLIDAQKAFRQLLLDGREGELVLAAGVAEGVSTKALEIVDRLKRPGFFEDLKEYASLPILILDTHVDDIAISAKRHLHPLAVATNLLQTDHTRLDIVLVTLANLYRVFSDSQFDTSIRDAVLSSLEKRWGKQDQAIFILAAVFNPTIRVFAFAVDSPFRVPNVIQSLAAEAFRRLFSIEPDHDFMTAVTQYLHNTGPWTDERLGLERFKAEAKEKGLPINLVNLWRNNIPIRDPPVQGAPPLPPSNGAAGFANLALHIASIVPNTTSTERIFCQYRRIQSAFRNGISHEQVRKQLIVRADAVRTRPMGPGGLKRKFAEEPGGSRGSEGGAESNWSAFCGGDPDVFPCGFADTIRNLVEEAEEDDTLSGALGEEFNLPAGGLPGQISSSQTPQRLRTHIPPDLRPALELRVLFPQHDNTPATAKYIFDDFWNWGELALAREEKMQETVNKADQES